MPFVKKPYIPTVAELVSKSKIPGPPTAHYIQTCCDLIALCEEGKVVYDGERFFDPSAMGTPQ